jgi:hypothetical protein
MNSYLQASDTYFQFNPELIIEATSLCDLTFWRIYVQRA